MAKIEIAGSSTGTATYTIQSPSGSTNRVLSLPDNTGTIITQNSTPAFASTIGVGGATAAASGAGITFPATQSASSDANTLDDYEEGTWTPSLVSSGGGETVTYSGLRTGRYTKIGRVVYFQVDVQLATQSGGSGNARITGLPFTAEGNAVTGGATAAFWSGTTTVSPPFGNVVLSDTRIDLRYNNTTTSTEFPWANVGSNARFLLIGFYTV